MSTIGIFALAGRRLDWLAERRAAIAANISNASTPGYRARDVAPFAAHLARGGEASVLVTTHGRHLVGDDWSGAAAVESEPSPGVTGHSGNDVSLDRELMKAGEVGRGQQLSLGVIRAFHRMSMTAAKG